MKRLKFVLMIVFVGFSSCTSNDDIDTTPIIQEVKGTLDLNALASITDNDATHLIKFNGVAADQFTSEAIVGDQITYTIETNDTNTIVRLIQYTYSSGDTSLWARLETVNAAGWLVGLKVKEGATNNLEIKFNIRFQLEVNGVLQTQKTYLIDPKIRIKAKR